MDEMIFVRWFVHLFVCAYKTCKVMDSDFNFFLFSCSLIFFPLFRYRWLTRFVCHTNTHSTPHTFPVNKTKSVLISVNLKTTDLSSTRLRICIDFFFFYSSLSHTQFCWLNAHIVFEQTLYFAYFRIWMFSATKHLCVCFLSIGA